MEREPNLAIMPEIRGYNLSPRFYLRLNMISTKVDLRYFHIKLVK